MSYDVAIVSHARAKVCNDTTLRLLADRGVDPACVRVFVDPAEHPEYLATLDTGLYEELCAGAPGPAGNRNAAHAYYPEDTRLVCLDDDVHDLRQRVSDTEHVPVADATELFSRGFAACAAAGATLWGIYPVLNAMFMQPGASTDLRFCVAQCHGVTVVHEPWAEYRHPPKGDYWQTLVRYEHDGAVVRLNDVAAKSKQYAQGGLASTYTEAERTLANRSAVMALRACYPGWVKVQRRRSKSGLEVLLRDPGCPPR